MSQQEVGEIVAAIRVGKSPGSVAARVKHRVVDDAEVDAELEGMRAVDPGQPVLHFMHVAYTIVRVATVGRQVARNADARRSPK